MRKVRQRKLKQQFENTFGRPVSLRPRIVSAVGQMIGYIPSEWRRLKKAARSERTA